MLKSYILGQQSSFTEFSDHFKVHCTLSEQAASNALNVCYFLQFLKVVGELRWCKPVMRIAGSDRQCARQYQIGSPSTIRFFQLCCYELFQLGRWIGLVRLHLSAYCSCMKRQLDRPVHYKWGTSACKPTWLTRPFSRQICSLGC